MVRRSLWLTVLLLAACGDDSSGVPPVGRGGGTPLSGKDISEALERSSSRFSNGAEDLTAAMDRAAQEYEGKTQAEIEALAAKARTMATRALTAADLEKYLGLLGQMKGAAKDPAALKQLLAGQGLTQMEWGVLASRVAAARLALRMPADKLDPKIAADVATLRPFLERLEAALRGQ